MRTSIGALVALAVLTGENNSRVGTERLAGVTRAAIGNTAVTTGYAPVDGGKLYYEMAGAGAVVVLIHGGRNGRPECGTHSSTATPHAIG